MSGAPASPAPRHPLIANSAALKLVVMLRHGDGRRPDPDLLGRHLGWMVEQEAAGQIFLSGPVAAHDGSLMGLTVFRTASIETADALARTDPFVTDGLIRYDLYEWTALEGSMSLRVSLSDGRVAFG